MVYLRPSGALKVSLPSLLVRLEIVGVAAFELTPLAALVLNETFEVVGVAADLFLPTLEEVLRRGVNLAAGVDTFVPENFPERREALG